jgi:hypothetical protein
MIQFMNTNANTKPDQNQIFVAGPAVARRDLIGALNLCGLSIPKYDLVQDPNAIDEAIRRSAVVVGLIGTEECDRAIKVAAECVPPIPVIVFVPTPTSGVAAVTTSLQDVVGIVAQVLSAKGVMP